MGWEEVAKHLSAPAIKLLDVVGKGSGNIFSLCFAKRLVDNKKYEIEQIGSAIEKNGTLLGEVKYSNGEVSLESLGSKMDSLEERTKIRKEFKALKEQKNIESIILNSAEQLSSEKTISEEPVDDDWIARFFKYAEDITNEDMQKIWGKVLAGEIKQPETFSLRTLEVLRNLTKKDADILTRAANLKISSTETDFIHINKTETNLDKYNFTFKDQLHLKELGILQSNPNLHITLNKTSCDSTVYFDTGKYLIKVCKEKDTSKHTIYILSFTSVGREILKLINATIDENYFKEFCKEISSHHLKLEYAFVKNKVNDNNWNIIQPWLSF